MKTIRDWQRKEEAKAKIARLKMRTSVGNASEALFQYERAIKAEATARVLRKVLKLLREEK